MAGASAAGRCRPWVTCSASRCRLPGALWRSNELPVVNSRSALWIARARGMWRGYSGVRAMLPIMPRPWRRERAQAGHFFAIPTNFFPAKINQNWRRSATFDATVWISFTGFLSGKKWPGKKFSACAPSRLTGQKRNKRKPPTPQPSFRGPADRLCATLATVARSRMTPS